MNSLIFSNEQIEQLKSKVKLSEEHLKLNTSSDHVINCDEKPWKLEFENKELKMQVFHSEANGSLFRRFRADCIVDDVFTPHQLMDLLANHEHRLTWDRNMKNVEETLVLSLENDNNDEILSSKLIILHCETAPVGPISGRDFTDALVITYLKNGSVFSTGTRYSLFISLSLVLCQYRRICIDK